MATKQWTTDEELAAAAFTIREAGDVLAAITEGLHLRRELPSSDASLAENGEALLQIMFDDELEELQAALRRASDDAALPPLVKSWLRFGEFWPQHERSRRQDAAREALVVANSGHMAGVEFDGNGPDGRDWYFYCACTEEESDADYRATRDEAMADLTVHLFEYGLSGDAIEEVAAEDARE